MEASVFHSTKQLDEQHHILIIFDIFYMDMIL